MWAERLSQQPKRFVSVYKLFVLENRTTVRFETLIRVLLWYFVIFPALDFFMHSHINKKEHFWTRLKEMTFALAGKRSEHLEKGDNLCVHYLETSNGLIVQERKASPELIHCLFSNVFYRLYAATNQSINDPKKQTLRPEISQVAVMRDSTVH